jgi:hypothetical protein
MLEEDDQLEVTPRITGQHSLQTILGFCVGQMKDTFEPSIYHVPCTYLMQGR